jgi:putative CocE/NonD family hydrolase
MMPYIYDQQATRKSEAKWWASHADAYETYLQAGSAGELGRGRGLEQIGFWRKILEHPTYDAFWRDQAVDKILGAKPLSAPVMIVHSLWDQEDIYGAPAVYQAMEPKDVHNDKVFLVVGPWNHGQQFGDGSSLGAIRFHSDTSRFFRHEVLRPFLDQHLQSGAPAADLPPVLAFETGANAWRRLSQWPAAGAKGGELQSTPMYLQAGGKLALTPPKSGDAPFEEYLSDPAKPIPFCRRPIQPASYEGPDRTWPRWLVDDQREAASRPDVAVFVSEVLSSPVKICGRPTANLIASTSGSDADWVVKLIDVFPEASASQPTMGGYQLMVAADIFRGRYREGFDAPKAIAPNAPLLYRFPLPTAHHVFLKGHRIMVQVQSSWFPLYDRNPQTFVSTIFWAKPTDYRKAIHRIHHHPDRASFVELPIALSK